jgi:ParB family chromosome partitioning protein
MAKPKPTLKLSASRDVPFNKLVLSQANVRRIKAGISIEELAEDIARRTLLQSLTVRTVLDEAGHETGMYEIPAGGRRYRALELLVKQKRLALDAPIPCVVRTDGLAEEDSLAENIQRAPLHPLDQFRAFQAMREKGRSEEEIAAAFFVSVGVVRQRLKLAAVSPRLLEAYAEDGLTLDQLMAFTVNPDHERQEQVFERLGQSYDKAPYVIRRLLTEGAVRASDKRAQFVGVDTYVDAGGAVLNDLFQTDDGGWLQDAALLDRLVAEKLEREAEAIRAEGWKWVEVAIELPYGQTYGLRQVFGEQPELTDEQQSARDALQAEFDQLEAAHADLDELPEDVDQRLAELETALEEIDGRPEVFAEADKAIAGAFVNLDRSGALKVLRGFVRPEDEPRAESEDGAEAGGEPDSPTEPGGEAIEPRNGDEPVRSPGADLEPDEDEGVRPFSERLMAELTSHRTVALRDALAERPDVALLAVLHALVLKLFHRYGFDSCLEIDAKSVGFAIQGPGLADCASAKSIEARHQAWIAQLPKAPEDLWDALAAFDGDSRQALFAHCVGLTVNAVVEPYNRRPRAVTHADRLAAAVGLDLAGAGWSPTVDNFFGRVTKGRILAAVRESCGEPQAQRLEHMRKAEMAEKAEELLAGSGWLPEPLRTAVEAPPPTEAQPAPTAQPGDEGAAAIAAE